MCPRKAAACWVAGACDTLGSPPPPLNPDPNSPEDSVALKVKVERAQSECCFLPRGWHQGREGGGGRGEGGGKGLRPAAALECFFREGTPTGQPTRLWQIRIRNVKVNLMVTWGAVDINEGVLLECDGLVWLVGGRCGHGGLSDHLDL